MLNKVLVIICLGLLCSCSTTRGERIETTTVLPDGKIIVETTMKMNRLDSELCIKGDCLRTKNASLLGRLGKIPQLFQFVLLQTGSSATP